MVLDLRRGKFVQKYWNQRVTGGGWQESPVGQQRMQPLMTSVSTSHTAPPMGGWAGVVLHRYSIGCSFSLTQSQCLGKKEKERGNHRRSCPSVNPWKTKYQVVGRTVGTLLVLLQTWLPGNKKIAFRWGHQVSHVSADRALAGGQGSQCNDKVCSATSPSLHGRPQSSSFFLMTFSWSRPLRVRMKPVKPSSCTGSADKNTSW